MKDELFKLLNRLERWTSTSGDNEFEIFGKLKELRDRDSKQFSTLIKEWGTTGNNGLRLTRLIRRWGLWLIEGVPPQARVKKHESIEQWKTSHPEYILVYKEQRPQAGSI